MGQPIRPVGEFLVGASPAIADECSVITEPVADHGIGQLVTDIDVSGIVEAVEQEVGLEGA